MKSVISLILISLLYSCSSSLEKRLSDIPPAREAVDSRNVAHITVRQVINSMKDHTTCEWTDESVDVLKTGSLENEVTGIVTTFMATVDVIKKAKSVGANMIITHEPTFYNHFDNMEPLMDDSVQKGKSKLINDAGITILRYHDFMHLTDLDGINQGLIDWLGWQQFGNHEEMIFELPETSVRDLSKSIADRFGTSTVRVIGDPEMPIDRVGVVPGAWGSIKQIEWLNMPGVDAVIVGESREWETVEYVRDMNALGIPKALIVMGHADSEDPGMEWCAEWLEGFISEVPITFIRAGNPMWSPNMN